MLSGIVHNSFDIQYRQPFGAVSVNTVVRLYIDVPSSDINVRLKLWSDGDEREQCGHRLGTRIEFDVKPEKTGLIWYYFILDTKDGVKYYGGRCGEGSIYDYPPSAYQITVYDPGFETPEWFRESIAYQVFPDRFKRAENEEGLVRAKYHTDLGRRIMLHGDWNEPVMYTLLDGMKDYEPCDFYGGDIRGIIEMIPYIKSLNISTLYLNPIFESPSNHRYNTSDYMKVDPILGDEEDLKALIAAAKENGIKIMLDGVFSHTGDDSVYFNKYSRYESVGAYNSRQSEYYDWYDFAAYPDSYKSWWGFTTLPEVKELTPSYMSYIKSVIRHYASLGLTSWRLDVADELPDEFIAFLRTTLKEYDCDGVLLGEVWDDASNKEGFGARRKYVDGHELDSCMNYPLRSALMDFLLYRCDADGLAERLHSQRENYPKPFYYACLNLIGSHDTMRAATALGGAPDKDSLTRSEQAMFRLEPAALARGKARLILCAIMQMAFPGVPCIYYGDEAGQTGMDDPFNRATYPYGREDNAMVLSYKHLTSVRAECSALRNGRAGFLAYDKDVFAILRTNDESCAMAIVNRSETSKTVSISSHMFTLGPDAKKLDIAHNMVDTLTGACVTNENDTVNIVLAPLCGALLTSR